MVRRDLSQVTSGGAMNTGTSATLVSRQAIEATLKRRSSENFFMQETGHFVARAPQPSFGAIEGERCLLGHEV